MQQQFPSVDRAADYNLWGFPTPLLGLSVRPGAGGFVNRPGAIPRAYWLRRLSNGADLHHTVSHYTLCVT